MLFNSLQFLIFFPVVTLAYFLIPHRARWVWLLIASYYFYMCWNPLYVLLLFCSTLVTYLSGILIGRAGRVEDEKRSVRLKMVRRAVLPHQPRHPVLLQVFRLCHGRAGRRFFPGGDYPASAGL